MELSDRIDDLPRLAHQHAAIPAQAICPTRSRTLESGIRTLAGGACADGGVAERPTVSGTRRSGRRPCGSVKIVVWPQPMDKGSPDSEDSRGRNFDRKS